MGCIMLDESLLPSGLGKILNPNSPPMTKVVRKMDPGSFGSIGFGV
jgi:hypothetical protein